MRNVSECGDSKGGVGSLGSAVQHIFGLSRRNRKASTWCSSVCIAVYGIFERGSNARPSPPSRHALKYPKKSCSFAKPQHQPRAACCLGGNPLFPRGRPSPRCLHSTQLFVRYATPPTGLGAYAVLPRRLWFIIIAGLRSRSSSISSNPSAHTPKACRTDMAPCPKVAAREPQWLPLQPSSAVLCDSETRAQLQKLQQ